VTFVTPAKEVITCGGVVGNSAGEMDSQDCLVLKPDGWKPGVVGNLSVVRGGFASVVTLPMAVFILGGFNSDAEYSSEVLLSGESNWTDGPELPISMDGGCAVKISNSSFLIINGINIREFDASVAGPLNAAGWQNAALWPNLIFKGEGFGRNLFGCAAIAGLVVVAGGQDIFGTETNTVEILNLTSKNISPGQDMRMARSWFSHGLAVLPLPGGGGDRVLALGGLGVGDTLDTVDEWVPGDNPLLVNWTIVTSLMVKRESFGAVALPEALACPSTSEYFH
jgi:hypothetical protein